jgi:hypothetical protein
MELEMWVSPFFRRDMTSWRRLKRLLPPGIAMTIKRSLPRSFYHLVRLSHHFPAATPV